MSRSTLQNRNNSSALSWYNLAGAIIAVIFWLIQPANLNFPSIVITSLIYYISFLCHERGHLKDAELDLAWGNLELTRDGISVPGSKGMPGIKASLKLTISSALIYLILSLIQYQYSSYFIPVIIINLIFTLSIRDWQDVLKGRRLINGTVTRGTSQFSPQDDEDEAMMMQALWEAKKSVEERSFLSARVGAVIVNANGEIIGRANNKGGHLLHAELFALIDAYEDLIKKSSILQPDKDEYIDKLQKLVEKSRQHNIKIEPLYKEVVALLTKIDAALGSEEVNEITLYVTLQPCDNCAILIAQMAESKILRIKRVVYGVSAVNPRHAVSIDILNKAGINDRAGVLAKECAKVTRGYLISARYFPWVYDLTQAINRGLARLKNLFGIFRKRWGMLPITKKSRLGLSKVMLAAVITSGIGALGIAASFVFQGVPAVVVNTGYAGLLLGSGILAVNAFSFIWRDWVGAAKKPEAKGHLPQYLNIGLATLLIGVIFWFFLWPLLPFGQAVTFPTLEGISHNFQDGFQLYWSGLLGIALEALIVIRVATTYPPSRRTGLALLTGVSIFSIFMDAFRSTSGLSIILGPLVDFSGVFLGAAILLPIVKGASALLGRKISAGAIFTISIFGALGFLLGIEIAQLLVDSGRFDIFDIISYLFAAYVVGKLLSGEDNLHLFERLKKLLLSLNMAVSKVIALLAKKEKQESEQGRLKRILGNEYLRRAVNVVLLIILGVGIFWLLSSNGYMDWYLSLKSDTVKGVLLGPPVSIFLDMITGVFIWGLSDLVGQYLQGKGIILRQSIGMGAVGLFGGALSHIIYNLPEVIQTSFILNRIIVLGASLVVVLAYSYTTYCIKNILHIKEEPDRKLKVMEVIGTKVIIVPFILEFIIRTFDPQFRVLASMPIELLKAALMSVILNSRESVIIIPVLNLLKNRVKPILSWIKSRIRNVLRDALASRAHRASI